VKRREFLGRVGSAAVGLTAIQAGALGCSDIGTLPRHWAWAHGGRDWTPEEWCSRFAQLRAAGIGGVLASGGDTEVLATAAHAEGLQFHRWIWTLNRSGDRWVKANHPEWFTVSRNGDSSLDKPPYVGYYQWLCPTREPVREYLSGIVEQTAREPGVDGVHLDYVRHSDVILPVGLWSKYNLVQDREYPEFDFCYCEVCRETFRQATGRDLLTLPDPTQDAEWREFRWDSVTGLVRVLADAAHGSGKKITAAVFPTPTLARQLVRQAWEEWSLDAVFPMLYHEFYVEDISWIGAATREGVGALPSRTQLFSGLYLPDLTPEDLARAVRVALDAGAAGVSLFEMDGLSEAHLQELGQLLTD